MVNLKEVAELAIEKLKAAGFDDVQVSASLSSQDELNVANNEASLLRSTEDYELGLIGIIDGRKASTTLTDFAPDAITHSASQLFERAQSSPQDEANAVSSNETMHHDSGPESPDLDLLTLKTRELLDFRAANTPTMTIEEGASAFRLNEEVLLTSAGSELSCRVGRYSLSVFGTASDGENCSSFNAAGGTTLDLSSAHASEWFGIGEMMAETERQVETVPVGGKFVGQVLLAPDAVADLVYWLLGQLGDGALISNSSIYRDKVGEMVASGMLNLHSRFDGPGLAPYTSDGFVAKPIHVVSEGKLGMLLPSLYGSRKTGISHVPASAGWVVTPGTTSRAEMIASVTRGALVSRLSMGQPGPNGDFSGVIKNSFLIENGEIGPALSETMISGNMAQMLCDITAISSEHRNEGRSDFPWILIPGLHFS